MFTQPGLARRAARRVQRHEAMDARVRLSSLDSCRIILIDDAVMKARGWTTELLLRHEIGHCNGWPGNHPGERELPRR